MSDEPSDYAAELERIAPEALWFDTQGVHLCDKDQAILCEAAALIRRQAEEVATLRQVMMDLQWDGDCEEYQCPSCRGRRRIGGHAPDCRLKAALDGK